MSFAFVLIRVIPGKEQDVYNLVSTLKYVTEIHPILGEFDIIARIETEDLSKIGKLVIQDIRTISGVVDTKTLTEIKL